MNSAIYRGTVRHRRWTPVLNAFKYSVYLLMLDLDELDTVFADQPLRKCLWSTSRPALARFRRRDFMRKKPVEMPLKQAAIETLREHGCHAPIGAVQLLTNLRYCGTGLE